MGVDLGRATGRVTTLGERCGLVLRRAEVAIATDILRQEWAASEFPSVRAT